MKREQSLQFNSILFGWSTLIFACFPVSIASSQQADDHLIAPIVVKATGYHQINTRQTFSDSPDNRESTRRRETAREAPVSEAEASGLPKLVLHAFKQTDSQASSLASFAGYAKQDDEKQDPMNTDGKNPLDRETKESDSDKTSPDGSTPAWARKKIQDVRTDIRELETISPIDRSSDLDYGMADWTQFRCAPKTFAWVAPDIRYQPLYFEDVALERYGQTLGFHRQTFRSGFHFFKSSITFPNKLRFDAKTCDYPLGFCRPGTCVPAIEQKHYLGRPH